MAGYDPKRPRPAAGRDEPAPVEALIDLADHKSPDEPPRRGLTSSDGTASGEPVPSSQVPPVQPEAGRPVPAPRHVSSEVAAGNRTMGRTSRLVVAGVLAACAAVLLVVALRRRKPRSG